MKRGKVAVLTGDEERDLIAHIKDLHNSDEGQCGIAYLAKSHKLVLWCYMMNSTGNRRRDKPVFLTHIVDPNLIQYKLHAVLVIDEAMAKWNADACSKCRSCEGFREKHCDCFKTENVHRFANSILRSVGIKTGGKTMAKRVRKATKKVHVPFVGHGVTDPDPTEDGTYGFPSHLFGHSDKGPY